MDIKGYIKGDIGLLGVVSSDAVGAEDEGRFSIKNGLGEGMVELGLAFITFKELSVFEFGKGACAEGASRFNAGCDKGIVRYDCGDSICRLL